MSIEYIASGTSHMKLSYSLFHEDQAICDLGNDVFREQNTKYDEQKFGLLFNAMTEVNYPKAFNKFRDSVNTIHSDSGGLQLMQLNQELTPEIEQKIYNKQVYNSDLAMSFDVMPLEVDNSGGGDTKTKMSMKKFIVEDVEKAGRSSGQNVRRQLEYFAEHLPKSSFDSKPLIVVQGNSDEDYKRYFDAIIGEIPEDLHEYIGGMALAGSSIGIGTLEALDSLFSLVGLDVPDKVGNKLHLLGYGSIKRLAPVIIGMKNGMLDNYHISYDSTSHTRKYNFGAVVSKTLKDVSYGIVPYNPVAMKIFGEVYDRFKTPIQEHLKVDKDEWLGYVCKDLVASEKFHTGDISARCNVTNVFLSTMFSIDNFMNCLQDVIDDYDNIHKYAGKEAPALISLSEIGCTSCDDWYGKYRDQYRQYMSTDRVQRVFRDAPKTDLSSFFI